MGWDKQCPRLRIKWGTMKRRTNLLPQSPSLSEVHWYHNGIPHRVRIASTADLVAFERQREDGKWEAFSPDPMAECFTSVGLCLTDEGWAEFVRQLPTNVQDYLSLFKFERVEALAVVSQSPEMLADLDACPALTLFLAAHVTLRGTTGARWKEISAVYNRAGLFGVLEWIGLPASPQTLAVLNRIVDPELPRYLLSPIRAALWEPESLFLLQRSDALTERELADRCHPLAA
jgi:hypothetical protein